MSEQPGLPDDVALLWGLRGGTKRGPKPALSVEDITRAAVDLADEVGLPAVSMARVAAKLGNSTMALYRHVKSKDELVLLMADAALEDPPTFPPDADWRACLTLWANSVLTAIRKHGWWVQIPVSGPPIGPRNLTWFDRALSALEGTGVSEEDKVELVIALLMYVHGEVRLSVYEPAQNVELINDYGAALAQVVDPARLPSLAKVVGAGVFNVQPGDDVDIDWNFGLNLVMDGMAAFIARRQASH